MLLKVVEVAVRMRINTITTTNNSNNRTTTITIMRHLMLVRMAPEQQQQPLRPSYQEEVPALVRMASRFRTATRSRSYKSAVFGCSRASSMRKWRRVESIAYG